MLWLLHQRTSLCATLSSASPFVGNKVAQTKMKARTVSRILILELHRHVLLSPCREEPLSRQRELKSGRRRQDESAAGTTSLTARLRRSTAKAHNESRVQKSRGGFSRFSTSRSFPLTHLPQLELKNRIQYDQELWLALWFWCSALSNQSAEVFLLQSRKKKGLGCSSVPQNEWLLCPRSSFYSQLVALGYEIVCNTKADVPQPRTET